MITTYPRGAMIRNPTPAQRFVAAINTLELKCRQVDAAAEAGDWEAHRRTLAQLPSPDRAGAFLAFASNRFKDGIPTELLSIPELPRLGSSGPSAFV